MLYVQETYLNATKGHIFGESDVYESSFDQDERGDLYRVCQREYGRCVSRVYVDGPNGAQPVGWVFQGRQKYDDTGESYLREVWVTVHLSPPTEIIEHHYA